jgi:molecular chaperone GrpE (heat shock protein)
MIPKDTLITISVGLSLVLVAGGIWLVWRKISRRYKSGDPEPNHSLLETKEVAKTSQPESPPVAIFEKIPLTSTTEESKFASDKLASLTSQIPDSDLKEFLKEITERVNEAGPCFDGETPFKFIEEMVDRLDDLRAILKNPSTQSPSDIESFRSILVAVLAECGAQLTHSDVWDPSCQRAIAKEVTPGIATPTILRFGSTGIRRHSQLVRKQEVVLAVPESN